MYVSERDDGAPYAEPLAFADERDKGSGKTTPR